MNASNLTWLAPVRERLRRQRCNVQLDQVDRRLAEFVMALRKPDRPSPDDEVTG